LRAIARQQPLTLAYVSGRDERLLKEAIRVYEIPLPHFAVGDVGTTIYEIAGDDWRPWGAWTERIAPDWCGMDGATLARSLESTQSLRLQEAEKQGEFKLSYYTDLDVSRDELLEDVGERLQAEGVRANLIWSIDEAAGVGLLDVLPASADKLHAIRFLMQACDFGLAETVFAGDSGNDLPVLTSEVHSVLVANASAEVKEEALRLAERQGNVQALYLAQGAVLGMNGNYSAGVLEGLAHYHPETLDWMRID
jgi:hydroxymethylpyrimidine pyrophosphatase-like HAD family hydrolase